jgi:cytochrome b subunit of formate dehydrogenase
MSLLPLVLGVIAHTADIRAQPLTGSQLQPPANACAECHANATNWDPARQHLFVSKESLSEDVHQRAGVNCHDCHGGDPASSDVPEAHAAWNGFRDLEDVEATCGKCHRDAWVEVRRKGVHFKAGERDASGRGTPLKCVECHGGKAHGMLPVDDDRSSVFLNNQVETCGRCHEKDKATYQQSTHGQGLIASGLLVTAVCADCHDAHGIYRAMDQRSTLHTANIADTCGKCHGFIEDILRQSVHGQGAGLGKVGDRSTPGGIGKRTPSCSDCHQGHDLPHPESVQFREELPHRCGNCHTRMFGQYAMSLHGELTELGYGPAAKCSDCHGAHDVLPASNPKSRLAAGNRLATCKQCHIYAVANFCDFDPHADHEDRAGYPGLNAIYHLIKTPLNLALGLFLLHAVFWFPRSFIHTLRHGRHHILTTGQEVAFIRFGTIRRSVYAIMLVCFLGLTLTGLPLKFGDQAWARSFVQALGGFESTSVWHRTFAVLAVFGVVLHLTWASRRILEQRKNGADWKSVLFGPDSPVPATRDLRDLLGMVRWFLGLGAKPNFERWTYWEKLDYWAVCLAIGLIGTSGLILWYPNVFCTVLPGDALNVAKLLHAELALYIAGCVFVMHLFNTHLRPEKFPLDPSVVTGLVSEDHLRSQRPEYLARIERSGEVDHVRRRSPSQRRVRLVQLAAFLLFLSGLGLLALALLAKLGR